MTEDTGDVTECTVLAGAVTDRANISLVELLVCRSAWGINLQCLQGNQRTAQLLNPLREGDTIRDDTHR